MREVQQTMGMYEVTEKSAWDRIIHEFPFWDVAHEWGYFQAYRARTWEKDSRQVLLVLENNGDRIAYPFFLKEKENGECSLEAVYGYTGALFAGDDFEGTWALFRAAVREYCEKNGITFITERFHPVLQNQHPLLPKSELELRRRVVVIQPSSGEELFASYRRKNVRKRVRQSIEKGVVISRRGAEAVDEILDIYRQTMQRNEADAIYYFEKPFLEALFRELPGQCNIFLASVGKRVIGFSLALHSPQCVFLFIGGMDSEYREYLSNYLLEHELLDYYHGIGVSYVNDGGGRTSDPEDPLLVFKRGFTKDEPVDYYVGETRLPVGR